MIEPAGSKWPMAARCFLMKLAISRWKPRSNSCVSCRNAQRLSKSIQQIEGVALERLKHYAWPGNIRELENAIERAVVLAEGERITLHDLPQEILAGPSVWQSTEHRKAKRISGPATPITTPAEAENTLDTELRQLRAALEQCGGNKAEAARLLGMPRSTFFSKLKKFALP